MRCDRYLARSTDAGAADVRTRPARSASSADERQADDVEADRPRAPRGTACAVVGERALDDAAIVGAMAARDETVALDPVDEAGRRGRAQVEDLGDPTHRLGTVAAEQEEQPDLAEGQVPGGGRRRLSRHRRGRWRAGRSRRRQRRRSGVSGRRSACRRRISVQAHEDSTR